jgi:hypothetical protein
MRGRKTLYLRMQYKIKINKLRKIVYETFESFQPSKKKLLFFMVSFSTKTRITRQHPTRGSLHRQACTTAEFYSTTTNRPFPGRYGAMCVSGAAVLRHRRLCGACGLALLRETSHWKKKTLRKSKKEEVSWRRQICIELSSR